MTVPGFEMAPRFEASSPPERTNGSTVRSYRDLDDALLATPRFEGAPPPRRTDALIAGRAAARRAVAARAQGGDPDAMGAATRSGEVGGPTKDLPTALTCGNGTA